MGAAASAATIKHETPTALSAFALRHCDLHLASGGEREDWEADERKKRKRAAAALEEEPRDFFHGIVPQQARASGYVALEDEAETDGARASRAAAEAWAAEARLRRDASLTRLDLKHGRVSDRVVVALVAALERYGNALTDLDLRGGLAEADGGCVGVAGAAALAAGFPRTLALRCARGAGLCHLDLSHNYFCERGWDAVADVLALSKHLRTLKVADVLGDPPRGDPPQKECRPDGALTVEDIRAASAALAAGLRRNASLTHLSARRRRVFFFRSRGRACAGLGRSYVRERAVGGVGLPASRIFVGEDLGLDLVAAALRAHPALERLGASVDRRDFESVAALQDLALFRAFAGVVGGALDVAALVNAAHGAHFHKAPWLKAARRAVYGPLETLAESSPRVRVGSRAASAIGAAASSFADSLARGDEPRRAETRGVALTKERRSYVGSSGGESIAAGGADEALRLRSLDLGSNKLGSAGVRAVCDALAATPADARLRKLKLRDTPRLSRGGCVAVCVAAIAGAVRADAGLAHLSIKDTRSGTAGLRAVADALRRAPSLTSLKLGPQRIAARPAAGPAPRSSRRRSAGPPAGAECDGALVAARTDDDDDDDDEREAPDDDDDDGGDDDDDDAPNPLETELTPRRRRRRRGDGEALLSLV
ncbi:hypothetical protein JL721_690 [Aureococcus anophagefferens]|nr:hypothetical protein JL721_690 [Aureococcus anophagefferens]